jgi:hypothetical protein
LTRELPDARSLSPATACGSVLASRDKTHITHIFQKLNLRNRVQTVVLVYQTGLFDTYA